ncbi:hypothetical protein IC229_07750 [Spirosoma sp. BT702]|uniref:Uncharacterized protein n=1 Tax=Spirosoma profusum TaxID=2771354 RepID=A0A926XUA7_9BACT|nr:hypothetical protein [Spirosoma profusum]MBD2700523.1 hypothetical protein [Spirosoma profusum]
MICIKRSYAERLIWQNGELRPTSWQTYQVDGESNPFRGIIDPFRVAIRRSQRSKFAVELIDIKDG